jgi:phage terminase large subunit GpA-like protein
VTADTDPHALVFGGLSRLIEPPEHVSFSAWLQKNIKLVDGAYAGELWSPAGAPYLVKPAECLSIEHPCTEVTIRKSQQTGASILALGWCLYIADRIRASTLYGIPGLDALRTLNSQKLQPLIDAWHAHIGRTVIQPSTSRSGVGSTTYEKKYPGGFLSLANSNAVMDLSMVTPRFGVKDEVSKWQTLPNDADPETLFFGRFTAFRRLKLYKILNISTPEVDTGTDDGSGDGHCRIDRSFRASDQQFWHVPCPECGVLFFHKFAQFQVDAKHPHKSVYECEHCSHHISEAERVVAVRAGEWLSLLSPDEQLGRQPGFHIDAFISMMMSYGDIADDWLKSQKSETSKKDFSNVVLGLPYKFRGDAPDHKRLMERREPYPRGHVPPRGLMLVAFVDVQMRGVWYEVIAVAPNRETWTVDADYIDGDTSDINGPAFEGVRKRVLDREYPDAFGRMRKLDALGVDSGYRSHIVYSWVRKNQRLHPDTGLDLILATKGDDGWSKPAIGMPSLVDIDLAGVKLKQGCKLWALGTWPLKGGFYSDLHKLGVRSGEPVDPDGYCHFGDWLDENYFKQLTDEHLEDIKVKGRVTNRRWVDTGNNHWLDCRIGNMALAEYLGLSSTTPAQWAALARHRGLPDELSQADLFTPQWQREQAADKPINPARDVDRGPAPEAKPAPAADADRPRGGDSWIGRDTGDWLKR